MAHTKTYEYLAEFFDAKGYSTTNGTAEAFMNTYGAEGYRLVRMTHISDGHTVIVMERETFT